MSCQMLSQGLFSLLRNRAASFPGFSISMAASTFVALSSVSIALTVFICSGAEVRDNPGPASLLTSISIPAGASLLGLSLLWGVSSLLTLFTLGAFGPTPEFSPVLVSSRGLSSSRATTSSASTSSASGFSTSASSTVATYSTVH